MITNFNYNAPGPAPAGPSTKEVNMHTYIITYHMHPYDDITVTIKANTEEEAIIYAKGYRNDAFSIEEAHGERAEEVEV